MLVDEPYNAPYDYRRLRIVHTGRNQDKLHIYIENQLQLSCKYRTVHPDVKLLHQLQKKTQIRLFIQMVSILGH